MRALILVGLALGLSACATSASAPGASPQEAPTVPSARNIRGAISYACDDGAVFTAVYKVSPDEVELRFADGSILALPHVAAASGARYATPTHEFWSKGEEAAYTVGRRTPAKCVIAK